MFKKLLSLLLALCMMLCLLPQVQLIAQANTGTTSTVGRQGDWSYDFFFRTIVKYHGSASNVTVPTTLGGYKMMKIGEKAFSGNTRIKKVTVPSNITFIESNAFLDCTSLETVVLPNNYLEMGNAVFSGCTKLKSINLPDNMESLGNEVFKNCKSLASITLPRELRSIYYDTFYGCSALKAIHIGANVDTICDNPFASCSSLQRFTVDSNNYSYSTDSSGVLFSKNGTKLVVYPAGKTGDYIVPYEITDILSYAFKGSRVSTVTFENEDTDISDIGIFQDCRNLTYVSIPANTWHMSYTFQNCTALTYVSIPDDTGLGNGVFDGCTSLKEINFEGVGNDPAFDTFKNVTATVYYPGDLIRPNTVDQLMWPEEKRQNYGGKLTWVPYCTGQYHYAETGTVLTEPTCQDTGTMDSICLLCGAQFIKILPAGPHPYTYETLWEATCQNEGRRRGTCTLCGHKVTETVPRLPHDIEGAEPIYMEGAGKHYYICNACGNTALTEVCTMTPYTPIREPSLTAIGLERSECEVCHHADLDGVGYRIRGASRYETSLAIADQLKQLLNTEKFDSVVLASGTNFPDALAGSYLAIRKNAPILLVNESNPESIQNYLLENLIPNGIVYILGGGAAVSQEIEERLTDTGMTTFRISGSDRYSTNLAILQEAGVETDTVLVCTGTNFADSLSASACGLPILLVNPGTRSLTQAQTEYLTALSEGKTMNFYIIGGLGAVPSEFETALTALGGNVTRISGTSREETSNKFAVVFRNDAQGAALTYSQNFPDGLCGGPLAYQLGIPLLLVNTTTYHAAANYMSKRTAPQYGLIFGGTSAVSDSIADRVFSAIS